LAIVILPSLEGDSIEALANECFKASSYDGDDSGGDGASGDW